MSLHHVLADYYMYMPIVAEKKEIPEEERLALREEFLHVMQERFLSGTDTEFNYGFVYRCCLYFDISYTHLFFKNTLSNPSIGSEVDDNTAYDDLTQEGLDAEEKYFASEEENETEETSPLAPDEYDYWTKVRVKYKIKEFFLYQDFSIVFSFF